MTVPMTLAAQSISTVFYQRVMGEVNTAGKASHTVFKTFLFLAGIAAIGFAILACATPLLPLVLGAEWQGIDQVIIPLVPLAAARFAVAPLAKTFSALERQREALMWQIGLIASGIGVLWVSSTRLGFVSTLWTYSITVALGYGVMLYLCLRLDKRDHSDLGRAM
jgi:O-antigen/teichoic acid export membrane protein